MTMAVLDGAIANVALPVIARDIHATPAGAVWVVNAYQLVIAVLLLPLAALGEVVGYARIFRAGLAAVRGRVGGLHPVAFPGRAGRGARHSRAWARPASSASMAR